MTPNPFFRSHFGAWRHGSAGTFTLAGFIIITLPGFSAPQAPPLPASGPIVPELQLIAAEPEWNNSRQFINGSNQGTRGTPAFNISTPITLQPGFHGCAGGALDSLGVKRKLEFL